MMFTKLLTSNSYLLIPESLIPGMIKQLDIYLIVSCASHVFFLLMLIGSKNSLFMVVNSSSEDKVSETLMNGSILSTYYPHIHYPAFVVGFLSFKSCMRSSGPASGFGTGHIFVLLFDWNPCFASFFLFCSKYLLVWVT